MNVLSLFDGISCGQIALERANIKVKKYFSSEIDDKAISVTQHNYPNTIQLGDVNSIKSTDLPPIDILLAGSPCQSFSIAGKQEGFNGKSGLFYQFLRLLKEANPKFFLLENVLMKKEYEDRITNLLGISPIMIDSASFSAQRRKRLYWTNIPVRSFVDKNILVRDILDLQTDNHYEFIHDGLAQTSVRKKTYLQYDGSGKGHNSQNYRACFLDGKSMTLSSSCPHGVKILLENDRIRKTTRLEHERLQTLPKGYTDILSINHAKSVIGNGWTVDVIAHILESINNK